MDSIQQVVDDLARRLHRSVAIDDPRLNLLAYSAHTGAVDQVRTTSILTKTAPPAVRKWVQDQGIMGATAAVRLGPNPGLGLEGRICIPIRQQGVLFGLLWLAEPEGTIGPSEIGEAESAAADAAIVLHRDQLLQDLRMGRERELVRDLLSDDPALRLQGAAGLTESDSAAEIGISVAIVAKPVHPAGLPLDELALTAIDDALLDVRRRVTWRHAFHLRRPDHGILIVVGKKRAPRGANPIELAEQLHAALIRGLPSGSWNVLVGVGDAQVSLVESVVSYRQALGALRLAEIMPSVSKVAEWSRLGMYRLLAEFPLERLNLETLPAALVALANRQDSALLDTLEAYLDHAGHARRAAEDLGIHRVSLYDRLHRVEAITGVDLENGHERLALHLGLKLARLAGLLAPTSGPRRKFVIHL
ncbi:MAG: PucR family transcriptional regulator [Candidatus Dormibacteria bacterium]